jgi:hypothetical protein
MFNNIEEATDCNTYRECREKETNVLALIGMFDIDLAHAFKKIPDDAQTPTLIGNQN